jgi:hypothetical protein
MISTIKYIIIGIFVLLLFFNIYFRLRVFKHYKILVQNRVEFDNKAFFNKQYLENEVLPKHPKFAENIKTFVTEIQKSVSIGTILIVLIMIMAFILKRS